MILVDINLLLYAHNKDAPEYSAARRWWGSIMAGAEPVGLAWVVVLGFVRLSTSRFTAERPLTLEEATSIVDDWFQASVIELVHPTPRHWTMLREQLKLGQASSNLVTDAHLATLAIEHGATLCTTDRDFTRFPGLKFVNPLESRGPEPA